MESILAQATAFPGKRIQAVRVTQPACPSNQYEELLALNTVSNRVHLNTVIQNPETLVFLIQGKPFDALHAQSIPPGVLNTVRLILHTGSEFGLMIAFLTLFTLSGFFINVGTILNHALSLPFDVGRLAIGTASLCVLLATRNETRIGLVFTLYEWVVARKASSLIINTSWLRRLTFGVLVQDEPICTFSAFFTPRANSIILQAFF